MSVLPANERIAWLCCQIEQALAILPCKPPGLAQASEAAWKMLGAPQGPWWLQEAGRLSASIIPRLRDQEPLK